MVAAAPALAAEALAPRELEAREFEARSDALIVHFQIDLGAEAGADSLRELRIYGDGRVVRSEPSQFRNAGESEMWLDAVALHALVDSLVERGVMSFEADAVKRALDESELAIPRSARRSDDARARAAGGRGPLFRSHDASTTTITLELLEAAPSATSRPSPSGRRVPARGSLRHSARFRGLRQAARMHPEIESLVALAAARAELEALMNDPRFVRRGASAGTGEAR